MDYSPASNSHSKPSTSRPRRSRELHLRRDPVRRGSRARGLADDVTTVTANDVRRWLASLQGKVAPSTEYRNYSGLRRFFAWCVREGELDVSPMANVRLPKVPEPRTEMLTREQMRALLADCAGTDLVARRDTAIILLFADTGIRLSELANMTTADLHLRTRVARVVGKGRRERTIHTVPAPPSTRQVPTNRRHHARADRPNLWMGRRPPAADR